MDSSTPTTPISKPRLLRPKLEYPLDSLPNSPLPTPSSATKKTSISIHSPNSVSLHDLLLLSPSPCRKSNPRPKPLILDECIDAVSGLHSSGRRKGKSRVNGVSPRNARRARRRLEKESAESVVPFEEDGRVRRKRQSRVKNVSSERLDLVVSVNNNLSPSSSRILDSEIVEDEGCGLGNGAWELISELVMWKNAAKSSLWFGLGTMIFGSSCFSKDVSFSMISAISHLGLLILGLAFFYDSVPQRQQQKLRGAGFKLKEEDILRVAKLTLPIVNAALSKSQQVFSGEPLMTLKVAPVLIFTAKYGHLITPWRLLATGFFLSFTLPKLYSCYSENIQRKVEEMRSYGFEAWKSCPRKKFVAASTTMVLWNLFSVKMRLFAAFVSVVVIRYHNQQQIGCESAGNVSIQEPQQAITVVAE